MIASKILPAFAVLGFAAAQSSICSPSPKTATINSQADASQYASCTTIKGSVVIVPSSDAIINLEGVETIQGDLAVQNSATLTNFGSSTLAKITGEFKLDNLTALTTATMAELVEVGSISWSALPFFVNLVFTKDIQKAKKVLITNTFLKTLTILNLTTVDELDINNNRRLGEFSTGITNVTRLNIDANGQDLKVTFPELVSASNITFRNTSSVSIPSLATVTGSIGFYGNNFDSMLLPNLTKVGESLAFVNNAGLTNLTLPLLTDIGGANLIANNSALLDISFPVLARVGGAIDFSGAFSSAAIPELEDVKGGFNMQSTEKTNPIDCVPYKKLAGGVIQGTFTCITTSDAKSGVGSGPGTGTSGGGSSPSSTPNAASTFGGSSAVAGLSVMGGLLGMLL